MQFLVLIFKAPFLGIKDGNFPAGCLIFVTAEAPAASPLLWRRMTPVLTSSSPGYRGSVKGHFVEVGLLSGLHCVMREGNLLDFSKRDGELSIMFYLKKTLLRYI